MTPATTRMARWIENAWLARYLDRELSSEEAEWFEAYVLDKPELLAAIDNDSTLRDALASSSGVNEWKSTPKPIEHTLANGLRKRRALPARWGAIAASLIVGLAAGSLLLRPRDAMDDRTVIGTASRVFIDVNRGVESGAQVKPVDSNVSGHGNSTYVVVDVAVPLDSTHITLMIADREVSSVENASEGDVTFIFRRTLLDAHPTVRLRYESNGRTEIRELPFDLLISNHTGR